MWSRKTEYVTCPLCNGLQIKAFYDAEEPLQARSAADTCLWSDGCEYSLETANDAEFVFCRHCGGIYISWHSHPVSPKKAKQTLRALKPWQRYKVVKQRAPSLISCYAELSKRSQTVLFQHHEIRFRHWVWEQSNHPYRASGSQVSALPLHLLEARHQNIEALASLFTDDVYMFHKYKAEALRQTGSFEEAITVLDEYDCDFCTHLKKLCEQQITAPKVMRYRAAEHIPQRWIDPPLVSSSIAIVGNHCSPVDLYKPSQKRTKRKYPDVSVSRELSNLADS